MPECLIVSPALSMIPVVWGLALLMDRLLGEPKSGHPLVGFGRFALLLEAKMNIPAVSPGQAVLTGAVACLLALTPAIVFLLALHYLAVKQGLIWVYLVDVLILYSAIGWRSLQEHVAEVAKALAAQDLPAARRATAMIVSRDAAKADEEALTTAALETSLENSSDALFASLFWYAIGGSTMVLLHRLANTLDAMWGYRNERYNYFGRCAARLDDVLNFFPSQCVSLCFCLLAGPRRFIYTVRRLWWAQGWAWKSINAGSVMASGAGALGVCLGGAATYDGSVSQRPELGCGSKPQASDLEAAFSLVRSGLVLWFAALFIAVLFQYLRESA